MTVTDTTDRAQTGAISFELELAHAPAKVWRALTEPALLARWLLPAIGFEPRAGAAFMFKTDPYPGWDGTVGCKVLEVEPEKKLSYTWTAGGDLEIDTVVTFTLAPTDGGTRLSIVQSGFKPEQKQNQGGARYGWKMMAGKLVDLLANES